jgi:hypothetical protein
MSELDTFINEPDMPVQRQAQVDRTREAIALCERARRGDLSARLTSLADDDPLTPLYWSLNGLLDLVEASQREASAALEAPLKGATIGGSSNRACRALS